MRWVDQIPERPYRCAVHPFIGNGSGHVFLQTGQMLDREGVYLSDVAVDEAAQSRGWVHPAELQARDARIAEVEAERDKERAGRLKAEEELGHFVALTREGWQARKPQGRKPKEKVEA